MFWRPSWPNDKGLNWIRNARRGQRKTVCQVNVFQNGWLGSVNHVKLDAVASIKGKDIEA